MRRCSNFSGWRQNERRSIFRRCLDVFSDSSTVNKSIKKQAQRDPWMSEDLPWLRLLLFFFPYLLSDSSQARRRGMRTYMKHVFKKITQLSKYTYIYKYVYTYKYMKYVYLEVYMRTYMKHVFKKNTQLKTSYEAVLDVHGLKLQ